MKQTSIKRLEEQLRIPQTHATEENIKAIEGRGTKVLQREFLNLYFSFLLQQRRMKHNDNKKTRTN